MDFSSLVEVFEKLEATTKRLELTDYLSKLFAEAKPLEIKHMIYLCQGILAPAHAGVEVGMAEKLTEQSIAISSGKTIAEIEKVYHKTGDLGNTAEALMGAKVQRTLAKEKLTVGKVYDNFYKIATSSGAGSQDAKIKLLAELLSKAEPKEAKALTRFIVGELRLGVGDATIIDALSYVKTGDKSLRVDLERAYNLTSDLGFIAELLYKDGIEAVRGIKPQVFYPIRPALAERLPSAKEIVEKLGECAAEGKYDGLRLQVHKKGDKVEIYSRRQERITAMFPDVAKAANKQLSVKEGIFEGEAVGYDETTDVYLSFQETITRKRKHGVEAKIEEIPIRVFLFEVLYADKKDYTREPYKERVAALKKILHSGDVMALAKRQLVKTGEELEAFFNECVSSGLEGIIAKDLNAPYVAGARKFAWIKLKRSYRGALTDTVDGVIVGYLRGLGKRAEFGIGALLCAVYDDRERRFKTIAKVGSGLTEKQMSEFKEMLDKIRVQEQPRNVEALLKPDVWVQPKYVITINADEITQSPIHTCAREKGQGLALRFPRLVELRTDKGPTEATTEKEVVRMFGMQKHAAVQRTPEAEAALKEG
jgi:DNA ligase-1